MLPAPEPVSPSVGWCASNPMLGGKSLMQLGASGDLNFPASKAKSAAKNLQ
jgi:hypothetical protein